MAKSTYSISQNFNNKRARNSVSFKTDDANIAAILSLLPKGVTLFKSAGLESTKTIKAMPTDTFQVTATVLKIDSDKTYHSSKIYLKHISVAKTLKKVKTFLQLCKVVNMDAGIGAETTASNLKINFYNIQKD